MSKTTVKTPSLCYKCAKCSAGCPVAETMDLLPHQLMHCLATGREDRALKAKTIWMCAGCFTCAVRCPNGIDITSVMDELREKAVKEGIPCPAPDVLAFHENFIRDLIRRGRIHELRMMGEYNMRRGKPMHNAKLGLGMLKRRKLHLLPPKRARGFKRWVGRLRKK